ncbi:uncharacterized protein ACIBXB_012040 [Morphnus guianensis]
MVGRPPSGAGAAPGAGRAAPRGGRRDRPPDRHRDLPRIAGIGRGIAGTCRGIARATPGSAAGSPGSPCHHRDHAGISLGSPGSPQDQPRDHRDVPQDRRDHTGISCGITRISLPSLGPRQGQPQNHYQDLPRITGICHGITRISLPSPGPRQDQPQDRRDQPRHHWDLPQDHQDHTRISCGMTRISLPSPGPRQDQPQDRHRDLPGISHGITGICHKITGISPASLGPHQDQPWDHQDLLAITGTTPGSAAGSPPGPPQDHRDQPRDHRDLPSITGTTPGSAMGSPRSPCHHWDHTGISHRTTGISPASVGPHQDLPRITGTTTGSHWDHQDHQHPRSPTTHQAQPYDTGTPGIWDHQYPWDLPYPGAPAPQDHLQPWTLAPLGSLALLGSPLGSLALPDHPQDHQYPRDHTPLWMLAPQDTDISGIPSTHGSLAPQDHSQVTGTLGQPQDLAQDHGHPQGHSQDSPGITAQTPAPPGPPPATQTRSPVPTPVPCSEETPRSPHPRAVPVPRLCQHPGHVSERNATKSLKTALVLSQVILFHQLPKLRGELLQWDSAGAPQDTCLLSGCSRTFLLTQEPQNYICSIQISDFLLFFQIWDHSIGSSSTGTHRDGVGGTEQHPHGSTRGKQRSWGWGGGGEGRWKA